MTREPEIQIFAMKEAPDGLTIGPATGAACWDVLARMRDPAGYEADEIVAELSFATEDEAADYAYWLADLMDCEPETVTE